MQWATRYSNKAVALVYSSVIRGVERPRYPVTVFNLVYRVGLSTPFATASRAWSTIFPCSQQLHDGQGKTRIICILILNSYVTILILFDGLKVAYVICVIHDRISKCGRDTATTALAKKNVIGTPLPNLVPN